MAKKYVSPSKLSTFLSNLKNTFAPKTHTHKLTDVTDYKVDTTLSSTSTNPVQNKVLDAEFNAISDAMGALEMSIDGKADTTHNHDTTYDAKGSSDSALASAKEYTDAKTSDLVSTTVADNKISTHNTSTSAHSDIRALISDLTTKLNNFLDVDDATSDQLSEVLTLIENNKGTLESLTTSKINVSDIVDNLTTSMTSKVLSANQGVIIKNLINTLQEEVDGKANATHTHAISDVTNLQITLDGKVNQTLITDADLNTIVTSGFYRVQYINANMPSDCAFGQLIVSRGADTITQIIGSYSSGKLYTRSGYKIGMENTEWTTWKEIIDSSTITSQSVNYANSAGNATTARNIVGIMYPQTITTPADTAGALRYDYAVPATNTGIFNSSNNANGIITFNKHEGLFDSQLGFNANGNIFYRCFNNTAIDEATPWNTIAYISSKVAAATTADAADKANTATVATYSECDSSGNNIVYTYATKAELEGKSSTSHTHTTVDGVYTGGGGAQPPSYVGSGKVHFNMMNGLTGIGNLPNYADFILMDTYRGGDVPYVTAFGISKTNTPQAYIAVGEKGNAQTWSNYAELISSANIGSQSVNYANSAGYAGNAANDSNGNNIVYTYATKDELNNKLSLDGGTMSGNGGIQYPTASSASYSNHFISAGGGYSPNSGKNGLKIIACDQSDCTSGLGQDCCGLSGGYELTVATTVGSGGNGYISFATHTMDNPQIYNRLGYFDQAGNLYVTGDVKIANTNSVIHSGNIGSQSVNSATYALFEASTGNALIHAGNIGSQSVNYANSAGSATNATNATNATSATYASYSTYDRHGRIIDEFYKAKSGVVTGSGAISVTLVDNTEYRYTGVTSLTLAYQSDIFESWIKITVGTSANATVSFPSGTTYIGSVPTFVSGKTYEISIKDKIVVIGEVG